MMMQENSCVHSYKKMFKYVLEFYWVKCMLKFCLEKGYFSECELICKTSDLFHVPIILLFGTHSAVAGNLQLEKGDYWKWTIPCL